MNPVTVAVEVSDESGNLSVWKLRSARKEIGSLISKGKPVLVTVEQGKTGEAHLEHARRYSKDLSPVKGSLRQANALLVISALRAAGVPTHTTPFKDKRKARDFLKNYVAAAVV